MADGCYVVSVLFNILLFLPVISLLRFKTVCKSWCSLIESSVFVTQHLYHNNENKVSLLMLDYENELSSLSGRKYQVHSNSMYEEIFLKDHFKIVNSCNGIVCLRKQIMLLSLWNPATKQVRQLPEPAVFPFRGSIQVKSALGFDKKTNDYKVVMITLQFGRHYLMKESLVQVYSMRTDSWQTIYEGNELPVDWTDDCVDVASNGEMFLWLQMSVSLRPELIFYFDLASEMYGTLPLPEHHANGRLITNLAFVSGKITFLRRMGHPATSYCEIWMMDEFGKQESWNKVYKLEEPIIPMYLLKNGEFILMKNHGGTPGGLYLYDLVTQEEMLLPDVGNVASITNYSESLVSIKSTKLI